MENVIVTGASGFLGTKLCNELSKRYKVYALVRDVEKAKQSLSNINIIVLKCEMKAYECFDLEVKAKYFFHFAWDATSGEDRSNYEKQLFNVKATCDAVVLAKKLGCEKFIYASSINEFETYEYMKSNEISPGGGYIYGTAKLSAHFMAEVVAAKEQIGFIPVIITNIYGPGEKSKRLINTSIRGLLNNEHVSFTKGDQMYDFIYIDDAINSIISVAEKGVGFRSYYLGSNQPKPLKYFIKDLHEAIGGLGTIGLGDLQFKGRDISYEQFNINQIERDTGYVNKINFKEGIEKTCDAIKEENL